ncbi:hypothetical protein cand_027700 [Cryptosporidium andersoni]|uniref:Uncharacterized protein n=1 Tax=Cryptosporidium andersoni TaxID=117008 RepID=A0A1J4MV33_9CRYT|nr:hypothetical protein cand_027700 [Cryptosporidium andersoni]
MNNLDELFLCGIFECIYTEDYGEIKHISPSSSFYESLSLDKFQKYVNPYYLDITFDGIKKIENQFHIVLRFNNTSNVISIKLLKMYILHVGIPVQINQLGCYLLSKSNIWQKNEKRASLSGSSVNPEPLYYRSIRIVVKLMGEDQFGKSNVNNDEFNKTSFYNFRILVDYSISLDNLKLYLKKRQAFSSIAMQSKENSTKDEDIEELSECDDDNYSTEDSPLPTMGHR